ncbi:MAG: hypothetical protein NBV65_00725 [Burkholderiaceae bacterium]|nr:hypothetical protein [Burkholderiaceae bacterium]
MSRADVSFAFRMGIHEQLKQEKGENEILASKKLNVRLDDGSCSKAVVFFRVPEKDLKALQESGEADSLRLTSGRFREFLADQGYDSDKIDQLFSHLRNNAYEDAKANRLLRQKTKSHLEKGQVPAKAPRLERQLTQAHIKAGALKEKIEGEWTKNLGPPKIAMGVVNNLFISAMNKGSVVRVDETLAQSEYLPPKPIAPSSIRKASKPLPATPAPKAGKGKPLPAIPQPRQPVGTDASAIAAQPSRPARHTLVLPELPDDL